MSKAQPWRSRIVGYGEEQADQLLANPGNWRIHPKPQQDALSGVLREVGIVQNIIVNKTTGTVVDGHLRVSLALREGQAMLPVTYVELTEAEEAEVLATLDPIGAMAAADKEKLDGLLREVSTGDAAVQGMLAELAEKSGLEYGAEKPEPPEAQIDKAEELQQKWQVQRGQVWEIGKHRLMCGDSSAASDVLALGVAACETLIVDPEWDAEIHWPERLASTIAFTDARRMGDVVLQYGAPAWVFVWDCVSCWYTPNRPLQRMKLALWYGDVSTFRADGAHYGDAGESRQVWNTRGEYRYVPDPRGKHLADVFSAPITRLHADRMHQHEKPGDWMRLLIGDCGTGDIYDPFCGAGASIVAAQQLERRAYGMEIEPKYCAVSLQRLADMGLEPRLT